MIEKKVKEVLLIYLKNKEEIGRKNKLWAKSNKKLNAKKNREYRILHINEIRERQKEYHSDPENSTRANIARNKKRENDPATMLNHKMGCSIRKSLGRNKNGAHWELLVGYDRIKLKQHLEAQFQEGMKWENYGEWHIDHIIPLSIFNIESVKSKGFKKAWSLENLRPMWSRDNIKKGNKLFQGCLVEHTHYSFPT